MADTTREVKEERLSNAFRLWTSEHEKQGEKKPKQQKPRWKTPKLQVINANKQHSNSISEENPNPEQHCSPERSKEPQNWSMFLMVKEQEVHPLPGSGWELIPTSRCNSTIHRTPLTGQHIPAPTACLSAYPAQRLHSQCHKSPAKIVLPLQRGR